MTIFGDFKVHRSLLKSETLKSFSVNGLNCVCVILLVYLSESSFYLA